MAMKHICVFLLVFFSIPFTELFAQNRAGGRWIISGTVRDEKGNWSFTVSPEKADGVWLPTGSTPQFDLTLRTYHPEGALLNDPGKAKLPTIKKERCA